MVIAVLVEVVLVPLFDWSAALVDGLTHLAAGSLCAQRVSEDELARKRRRTQ